MVDNTEEILEILENSNNNSNNNNAGAVNKVQGGRNTRYCWNFNKGVMCKFKHCKFVERCSYCDSGAHGRQVCPELENKDVTATNNDSMPNN